MEQLLRSLFQSMAKSKSANRWAKRYGLHLGAQRFVAGETIQSAIEAIRQLNQQGMAATLDHLGEFVSDPAEARASADYGIRTLEAIYNSGVQSSLSLKLTQMGLDIDRTLCMENMHRILTAARELGLLVTIDMEDSRHCQETLDILDELRIDYKSVGTVIQSSLYRSIQDVKRLGEAGVHLRIVKGAYREPASVAYQDKADVDVNYIKLVETHLKSPGFTAIATHDETIVNYALQFIEKFKFDKKTYEFQMLYGIGTVLQKKLVDEGYPVRVYVPYGNDWYGYFMRRLAERPANVSFVLRGIFR
ncbi:proline dehydrogenase family protein [Alicyclobacillus sp. SO9]|uniref:proline dehydrogenase family protein n=1 Tax=Alicyclobacillus sp. SO9 TaxID=2665646 RepID=UPI0018E8E11E|nr:proline dehydrogenase family protein [Alicyclobacillus sp. SO9]QQE80306.1 proline dehydrogenase family protein [Alicyclobacillus sp. SO9]